MDEKDLAIRALKKIGESICEEIDNMDVNSEFPVGFDQELKINNGSCDIYFYCGRLTASSLPFLPNEIKQELINSFNEEWASFWQNFATDYNREKESSIANPGNGKDYQFAKSAYDDFREKLDKENIDLFYEEFSERQAAWFDDEHNLFGLKLSLEYPEDGKADFSMAYIAHIEHEPYSVDINICSTQLDIDKITALCDDDNDFSEKFMEKIKTGDFSLSKESQSAPMP